MTHPANEYRPPEDRDYRVYSHGEPNLPHPVTDAARALVDRIEKLNLGRFRPYPVDYGVVSGLLNDLVAAWKAEIAQELEWSKWDD